MDYYAILQVQPSADDEVIDAAYRQLMKKYHPDRAADDAIVAQQLHERAKAINAAYRVLRDPLHRRQYDAERSGHAAPAAAPRPRAADVAPPRAESAWRPREPAEAPPPPSTLPAPLRLVATAYFLLPGPYEWEPGHETDVLTTLAVPFIALIGWELASGRVAALLNRVAYGTPLAWAAVVLLSVPFWRRLPHLLPVAIPTTLLLLGALDAPLAAAQIPIWLAWAVVALLGLLISARLYVFSVLPTLAVWQLLGAIGHSP